MTMAASLFVAFLSGCTVYAAPPSNRVAAGAPVRITFGRPQTVFLLSSGGPWLPDSGVVELFGDATRSSGDTLEVSRAALSHRGRREEPCLCTVRIVRDAGSSMRVEERADATSVALFAGGAALAGAIWFVLHSVFRDAR
ncbi:MAG: hypothetical protein ABJD07_17055 [Gemmatimonadaceae bacterium]